MIDDIVELPRPLRSRSCFETMSSYRPYELPTSEFGKALGFSIDVRDMPVCIGNEFNLLTGKDSPHRYKIIEHDDKFVREYVAISDGPIHSKDSKLFTLWVNQVDKKTLKTEKFYFWDTIDAARQYYGFQDCMLLSREVKDALTVSGYLRNYPGLARSYTWAHETLDPIRNEVDELERMFMLKANLAALEEADQCEYFYHPMDVFRGCLFDRPKPLRLITGSGRILSRGMIQSKDVKFLLGPDYSTRPFHMCLKDVVPLRADASIDHLQEFTGWFDVLKYVELIPYSESFISFSEKGVDVMRVYDPYDATHHFDINPDQLDDKTRVAFTNLREELSTLLPTFYKVGSIYRSWGEEVYITISTKDCKTKQFYFDMVYAALGSRMFAPSES